jgi:hypothetical protein
MEYQFATKKNDRKNSRGETVEKTRIWFEESKTNRFLTNHGFKRGESISIQYNNDQIIITLDEQGNKIVAGKADRSLFCIDRNRNAISQSFHPENNAFLIATVTQGRIEITCKK